jgi:cellulose synthase/poly-beta-1,6-N-acetylglucosamine synthase-like glycosyltransferase
MIWLENILWLVMGSYALFTLGLWWTWRRIPDFREVEIERQASKPLLSVIIPVRNEAERLPFLLEDLRKQSLAPDVFEVLVVNDASTDGTDEVVKEFAKTSTLNLRLLDSNGDSAASPKKRAIQTAIAHAKGSYLVTTDGDCRVGEHWLSTIVSCFENTGAKCISGPVTFTRESRLTDYLQTVEFSSLVGSGACAIAAGYPNMCNGANFAYEKAVFQEVNGFDGVDQIASGDDEFLLQKIAAKYPNQIYFLKSAEAVVQTLPHRTWRGFKSQRQRWASKWKYYRNSSPKILAVFVFSANVSFLLAGILFGLGLLSGHVAAAVMLLKILPEWLFIGAVLRFLRKAHTLMFIPLVQIFYPWYVLYFGLVGQKESYMWKGRALR